MVFSRHMLAGSILGCGLALIPGCMQGTESDAEIEDDVGEAEQGVGSGVDTLEAVTVAQQMQAASGSKAIVTDTSYSVEKPPSFRMGDASCSGSINCQNDANTSQSSVLCSNSGSECRASCPSGMTIKSGSCTWNAEVAPRARASEY